MDPLQEIKSAPDVEGCQKGIIQGVNLLYNDDHNSSNDSLWEHVLKVVAKKDVRSFGLQRKGKEGKDLEALVEASGREEAQTMGLLQLVLAPSSSNAISSVGI